MCRSIYLSTTSEEDLSLSDGKRVRFKRDLGSEHLDALELLRYPFHWYLTREFGGCSCHFRHRLGDSELDFEPPQPWEEVDVDDEEATLEAYHVFRTLVVAGHGLDVLCAWSEAGKADIRVVQVDLAKMAPTDFHFSENWLFRMVPTVGPIL